MGPIDAGGETGRNVADDRRCGGGEEAQKR
jgi:hypothetical protein